MALNNLQRLICHKTQTRNQTLPQQPRFHSLFLNNSNNNNNNDNNDNNNNNNLLLLLLLLLAVIPNHYNLKKNSTTLFPHMPRFSKIPFDSFSSIFVQNGLWFIRLHIHKASCHFGVVFFFFSLSFLLSSGYESRMRKHVYCHHNQ